MTVKKILKRTSPPDKELLLAHILQKSRVFLFAHPDYTLTSNERQRFRKIAQRRKNGEPFAYIIGEKEFFGRTFNVNKNTLIPRPETELLVELVLKKYKEKNYKKSFLVDVGTGSGNIIITLAKEFSPENPVTLRATDISQKALRVARTNANAHKCNDIITFHHANLLQNKKLQNAFTKHSHVIITANLPYVDHTIKKELLTQNLSRGLYYEPNQALWSGDGGLKHYKKLLLQTKKIYGSATIKNLTSFYEINHLQKKDLTHLIEEIFPDAGINFYKDLAGKWRVCEWFISE